LINYRRSADERRQLRTNANETGSGSLAFTGPAGKAMNRRDCLSMLTGSALSALLATQARAKGDSPSATEPASGITPTAAPPDPDTKVPTFRLPPQTCDTHTHIFGPASRYPYASKRLYTPPEAPLGAFRALHERIGVERCVIVNATVHGTDNRVVTDAIAQSEGAYKGIANVNDEMSDEEFASLDRGGICGCRFAFLRRLGGAVDMTKFNRVVHRVAELGWHVDVYFEPGTVGEFASTLRALPTSYVIDHMGTILAANGLDDPTFEALLDLQETDEKCWVKITGLERASASGKPFYDAVPFARRLIENAPDRVLWGTDWPHPNVRVMPNDGEIVDLIPLYAPDPAIQHKLLVENPARLFKFT
jgi:2-pyrone-4,6-dicarboxylate lactonase